MSNFFIFLDSRQRSYGNNTNFSVGLNDFNFSNNESVSVSVDEVNMFNLQYPINSTNKTITFQEDGVASDLTATLTEGNYTGSEIATELQTQLNSAGANTYTVSYNSTTGKLTISDDAGLPSTINLTDIDDIFGFVTPTGFLATHTGTNPINLSGVEYVDILLPNLLTGNMTTSANRNGIMKRIPLDVGWGGLVSYRSQQGDDSVIVNKEALDNVRVEVRNPDNTIYDLPSNANISIVLKCTIIS